MLLSEKIPSSHLQKKHKTINYERLIKASTDVRYQPLFASYSEKLKDSERSSSDASIDVLSDTDLAGVNIASFPLRYNFPTILTENSRLEPRCSNILLQDPFAIGRDLKVTVVNTSAEVSVADN